MRWPSDGSACKQVGRDFLQALCHVLYSVRQSVLPCRRSPGFLLLVLLPVQPDGRCDCIVYRQCFQLMIDALMLCYSCDAKSEIAQQQLTGTETVICMTENSLLIICVAVYRVCQETCEFIAHIHCHDGRTSLIGLWAAALRVPHHSARDCSAGCATIFHFLVPDAPLIWSIKANEE